MHGQFFWYDLMTTDTKAAAKFYGAVVGWGTEDSGVPGSDYSVFTVDGVGRLGLMDIPKDMPGVRPHWMGYISVDDVDKAAAKVKKLGGSVEREPTEIPNVIKFAPVGDPQGVGFLIAKGLVHEAMPKVADGTPGTIGWHELYAKDGKTAFDFYEKMFGWTKSDAHDMGAMGVYQLFKTGGEFAVGGIMTKPEQMSAPPHWAYYINVPAIRDAAKRVTDNGGRILMGPHQVPGDLWIVQCMDPQGAAFNLLAPKE